MNLNRKVESETAQSAEDQERLIRHFEFRMPSQYDAIDEYVDEFRKILQATWFKDATNDNDWNLVVVGFQEAVNNAVKYSCEINPEGELKVEIQLSEDRLTIKVKDQGPGFDPTNAFTTVSESGADRLEPHGRGMIYMRAGYDEVRYHILPGQGTEVTLIRKKNSDVGVKNFGKITLA